ncbi:MAG: pyrimidine-nucleoside phosphorylase [Lachnospiraceae bacterium]|nr:pyrimidine-nucleoside phosphorylase [Lachnospiraceae bacterium]
MNMYDLIQKKKTGGALTQEEIYWMVNGFTKGEIPDYQMSAMMMAIFFKGMTREETLHLTMSMAKSGEMLDLSKIPGIKADKHSTGGVGDKTSLALLPMVSACGLNIAKMSGRGLGHTGGTIDKLESFPGFRTDISIETFEKNASELGIALMGQTAELAPADKKLYALRDVTATVDQMSLIASSIMSKKLAAGADLIVLDVKTGSGAFMKSEEDSRVLAEEMVRIGKDAGRKVSAVISDMDQPLGRAVGNILEVKEAIATLKGEGPQDFTKLCMTLGCQMLLAGGVAGSIDEAEMKLFEVVKNGSALNKLADLVKGQGGDASYVYEPDKLDQAPLKVEVKAPASGFIQRILCDEVGLCSLMLGGGRRTKEDVIDLRVGLVLKKKVGDEVREGDVIAVLHAADEKSAGEAMERYLAAVTIGAEKPEERKLIHGIIE